MYSVALSVVFVVTGFTISFWYTTDGVFEYIFEYVFPPTFHVVVAILFAHSSPILLMKFVFKFVLFNKLSLHVFFCVVLFQ